MIDNYDGTRRSSTVPYRWVYQKEDYQDETYQPRVFRSQNHCSSCSCYDDDMRTPRSTSALRRTQLEEEVQNERFTNYFKHGKQDRRFRRDDEEKYSEKSVSKGLPRSQPFPGKFFEETDETDRYGKLPPVKRPISIRTSGEGFSLVEDEEYGSSDEDASDLEASHRQRKLRNYDIREYDKSDFYRGDKDSSAAKWDTSVIRL